jgi:uncharacterized protein (TIGR02466 family)
MQKIHAFPSPIYLKQLGLDTNYKSALINASRDLIGTSEKGSFKSLRGGVRNQGNIFSHPAFKTLESLITSELQKVLVDYDVPFADYRLILNGWINWQKNQGFNTPHVHPQSWFSGVYYLTFSTGAGRIFFVDPRPQVRVEPIPLTQSKSSEIEKIREKLYLNISQDSLIIFPSWLEHGTEVNESDERVSIAFNLDPIFERVKR